MTGFQELTLQQKMVNAINQQSIYGAIQAMRLGANPSEITDQNLRSKLLELLREDTYSAFKLAANYGRIEKVKYLVQLGEELGGKDLVTAMLEHGGLTGY